MTPAEERFKTAVLVLVQRGIYPAPTALGRYLGIRSVVAHHELDGRQTRWRRQVLGELGWVETGPFARKRRFSWTPPPRWRGRRGPSGPVARAGG